jgi:hypothetical protein
LIYTLVADEVGVAVIVLEILNHKKYEERFGYSYTSLSKFDACFE